MKKKVMKCEIDTALSTFIAGNIIEGLKQFPPEDISSVMNGIAVALMQFASQTSEISTEEGMVEKMILNWFQLCDKIRNTQFSKYINLD